MDLLISYILLDFWTWQLVLINTFIIALPQRIYKSYKYTIKVEYTTKTLNLSKIINFNDNFVYH